MQILVVVISQYSLWLVRLLEMINRHYFDNSKIENNQPQWLEKDQTHFSIIDHLRWNPCCLSESQGWPVVTQHQGPFVRIPKCVAPRGRCRSTVTCPNEHHGAPRPMSNHHSFVNTMFLILRMMVSQSLMGKWLLFRCVSLQLMWTTSKCHFNQQLLVFMGWSSPTVLTIA